MTFKWGDGLTQHEELSGAHADLQTWGEEDVLVE